MKKQIDHLIIGAGLAGSLLAKELEKKGHNFFIIDNQKKQAASRVAIGLTNPITGKRLVKSWLIDDLIPKARETYKALEKRYKMSFMHDCEIARVIPNQDIFEQWQPNFKQAIEEGYISNKIDEIEFDGQHYKFFLIQQAFWVDAKELVNNIHTDFIQKEQLRIETFDFSKLVVTHDLIRYKEIEAKNIIFCEGYQAIKNPYFSDLPFNLNKGEVVRASIKNYQFQHVLKKNIFILPHGENYRIGATYNREQVDELITETAKNYFHQKLAGLGLKATFIDHQAAIRPATVDRRPFIGSHKKHKNLYIFNGFGAKGVSLIPYFAEKFVKELNGESQILREASTRRFFS